MLQFATDNDCDAVQLIVIGDLNCSTVTHSTFFFDILLQFATDNDCDAVQLIVIGDLNCSTHSTFFDILLQFATDNNVLLTDMNRLSGVFTYCNDSATNLSWIDYVLCSRDADNLVSCCTVLLTMILSVLIISHCLSVWMIFFQ